jgi:membrane protease YdiL (CAAX protease family)
MYDDEEALSTAQGLLARANTYGWTAGQRARLYTELAATSERLDTEGQLRERTAAYARSALDNDVRADVRLILGAYYQETGDKAAALEALTSPFDGHDPDDNWYVVRKMAYLAELGARDAVVALHAKLDDDAYYDRAEASAALRAVGELELAQRVLEGDEGSLYGAADERQRFLIALKSGSAEQAHAAYEQWRDAGYWEDPVGINRFALFVEHPELPWQARDVLGMLGAVAFAAVSVLVWCVPLGLVHYRGLVNRVNGRTFGPDGLRLRDAWLGLAAFSLAGVFAMYAIGPFDAFNDPVAPWLIVAEQPQLATLLLVESVLAMVLLAAVVYVLRPHFARWWATDWSIGQCVLTGVGAALVFRLPLLVMMLSGFDRDSALRIDNAMWQTLIEVDNLYGPTAAIWVLSFAAPVGEELVFRGLLLRACLRHVSFPVANGLQALLFAAMHFDLAAMPFLFAFGLAAGWLARRSGGLLAPMVMHGVLNLVAGLLITA